MTCARCADWSPHPADTSISKAGCPDCGGATQEPIRQPIDASATRFKPNPNWSPRGDNTKYREKK